MRAAGRPQLGLEAYRPPLQGGSTQSWTSSPSPNLDAWGRLRDGSGWYQGWAMCCPKQVKHPDHRVREIADLLGVDAADFEYGEREEDDLDQEWDGLGQEEDDIGQEENTSAGNWYQPYLYDHETYYGRGHGACDIYDDFDSRYWRRLRAYWVVSRIVPVGYPEYEVLDEDFPELPVLPKDYSKLTLNGEPLFDTGTREANLDVPEVRDVVDGMPRFVPTSLRVLPGVKKD